MESFLQDLRYAVRQLVNGRATTLIAIVTLALGIGANTSMFTLLNATLFKSAPAAEPERLAWVVGSWGRSRQVHNMSYPDLLDVRARATSLSGVMGYTHIWLSFGGAAPERVRGELVTGNYFDLLGVRAAHGRAIRPDDDGAPGAHPVAVISDGFWRRRFGADLRILDSTITINGHPFTVVGVAPAGFGGVEMNDDEPQAIWLPMAMIAEAQPGWDEWLADRNSSGWLRTIGRLKPNATMAGTNAELAVIGSQLRPGETRPDYQLTLSATPVAGGLDPSNRREIAPVLSLLMLVPALVLLVACANAGNVLLSRALARRREIAVRRAMGATRGRIVRQLLTESVILSLVAGGVGVLMSFWLTGLIGRFGAIPDGILSVLTPDTRVLVATTLTAVAAGIVFGLAPALSATKPSLAPALKNEGVTLAIGQHRHRLRDVFVVGQVAVSLVLLVTAGLFARSLAKALNADPGYRARTGMYLSFDLGRQGYTPARQEAFERDIIAKVRGVPGVESAALASTVPFGGSYWGADVKREGASTDATGPMTFRANVSDAYFDALQITVTKGRAFTSHDDAGAPKVVIVNESLARRLWPNDDPIGKRLQLQGRNEPLREVVGVTVDGKYANLTEAQRGFLYLPERQQPSPALVLTVRSATDQPALIQAVTRAAQQLDPDLPLYQARTFREALRGAADKQQAAASMLLVFGALALFLAALGMYAVTAHGVTVRTREIGIRMSLGARAADVMALFVREGLGRSLVGIAIGLAVSAALSKVLAGFLFGLAPTDALTFALGAGALCAVAVIASYVPARRAARVDPVEALRVE